MQVELSGGIRDDASLRAALATGATRVNIGTAALEDPEWCDRVVGEYGDRVAIGLDVRGTHARRPAAGPATAATCSRCWPGWTGPAAPGTWSPTSPGRHDARPEPGPAARGRAPRTERRSIASGGVSTLDDLRALAALEPAGVEGVIVGKALYAGAFTVAEAGVIAQA